MISPERFRELYHSADLAFRQEITAASVGHLLRVMRSIGDTPSILEIGCNVGGTTKWFLQQGASKVTCIDTFEGSMEHAHKTGLLEEFKINTVRFEDRIEALVGESWDVLRSTLDSFGNQFDLIYIDACHHSKNVIQDAILSWPLLKRGGVMVFDDYEWNYYDHPFMNPKPAIDFFLGAYAKEMAVLEKNYQLSVLKL